MTGTDLFGFLLEDVRLLVFQLAFSENKDSLLKEICTLIAEFNDSTDAVSSSS